MNVEAKSLPYKEQTCQASLVLQPSSGCLLWLRALKLTLCFSSRISFDYLSHRFLFFTISLIAAKQKMNWTRTLVPTTFAATGQVTNVGPGRKSGFRKHSRADARRKSRNDQAFDKEISFAHTTGVSRCPLLFCSADGASVFWAERSSGLWELAEFPLQRLALLPRPSPLIRNLCLCLRCQGHYKLLHRVRWKVEI